MDTRPLPFRLLVLINLPGAFLASHLGADTELNIPGYRIHWHDEFEGPAVDSSRWEVNVGVNAYYQRASDGRFVEPHWFGDAFEPWTAVGPINDERQYYSPDNVSVADGVLQIRADRGTVADPVGWYDPAYHKYTSGKLNSADEFQFQFGMVRWRAQLPAGKGLWPALWMLNAPDPWYWDDEIDVMEARGSLPTQTSSAHHYKVLDGQGNRQNQYSAAWVDTGLNLQASFNEYTLEWEATHLRTWVNSQEVLYDTVGVPQGPMFLIMNAAVGGGFDGLPAVDTPFPTQFKIDWVRVWQKAAIPSDLASGGFEDYQGNQWANWNTLDDGNLSVYATGALHGSHSVLIDRRNGVATGGTRGPNLFTDGTASEWRGYLNQLTAEGGFITGGTENPSNIPAILGIDAATLPIHQNAPSPRAIAVIYREFSGPVVVGRNLTFSGAVTIEEPFPANTSAIAFIRIFNPDYSFTDVATPVGGGGEFSLQAAIPGSGVPFVQVGLETTGPTGSPGRLAAAALYVEEDAVENPGPDNRTGFIQTVAALPGQPVHFGLLAANHPTNPIGPGAHGRLRLEFLDADEAVLSVVSTTIIDPLFGAQVVPHSRVAVAPANAALARLSIERITTDPDTDLAGSFIVDAAFLQVQGATGLPVFASQPPAALTVTAGETVDLAVETASPGPVTYQWYHYGERQGTARDLQFTASPGSSGSYFVIATNAAGPVISAVITLTVLTPDTDGDRISDYDETVIHGTDPLRWDSDSDGISDYTEIFIFRTDPLDPMSRLRIIQFEIDSSQITLSFESVAGVEYFIEGSPDLSQWQLVGSSYTATASESTVMKTVPVSDPPLRFFRIGVAEDAP